VTWKVDFTAPDHLYLGHATNVSGWVILAFCGLPSSLAPAKSPDERAQQKGRG
jgi:hypothetical protein